ncbi:MAG TPA: nuclear transport factor 2 family protein [Actinomycetota bacterium]|jgi:ketosteroid isomerase-like protein
MAHPNEELIRRGYEAFGKGDMDTLNELFTDDIVWHSPGRNQLAGDFRGKQEVFGTFQKVFELTGGNFKLDIHDVVANDDHVVVLARSTGEREGKTLDDNSLQLFHVKNGKVTEQWLYPGDPYAADEFWS